MENKEIHLKTRKNLINLNKKSFPLLSLNYKFKKGKSKLNYKLKFKKDILINILKKTNLRKSNTHMCNTYSGFNNKRFKDKNKSTDCKLEYNLNKKFRDLPGISKFHNLTNEKINDLININSNSIMFYNYNNIKTNFIECYKNKTERNNTPLFNKSHYNNKENINYSNNTSYNKKKLKKYIIDSKRSDLYLNDINSNTKNNIFNLKSNNQHLHNRNNNYSFSFSKNLTNVTDNTSSNFKRFNLDNINKISNNYKLQYWISSLRESIKNFDYFHRGSKIDRLIFYIEKPGECFEENLLDEKPSDKYQSFKNQISQHKNKLENIIKEIKMNQIKSEYLMKKYIFDLLSRKKKIY